MHSLDKVIKLFKHLEKKESNSLAKSYFGWIVKGLLIENEYKEECEKCGKVLYHHFKYWLPVSFDSPQSTIDEFFLYI